MRESSREWYRNHIEQKNKIVQGNKYSPFAVKDKRNITHTFWYMKTTQEMAKYREDKV